jgi:hypothetical protein
MGRDGRARGTDRGPRCCVVRRTFGAIRLAGMGVGNSRPLDDRLRLSHSALVSALTWVRLPPKRITLTVGQLLLVYPINGHRRTGPARPDRANCGLMYRSKCVIFDQPPRRATAKDRCNLDPRRVTRSAVRLVQRRHRYQSRFAAMIANAISPSVM